MMHPARSHRLLILTLAVATLTLCAAPAAAQLANSSWPMFHGGLQHTGRTTIVGPATNALKWPTPYQGSDKIKASPAVGLDGTVYVAIGYSLCAIDPSHGTEKPGWEGCFPLIGDATMSAPAIDHAGNVYYGARDNRLYSIASDGTQNCTYWIRNDGDVRTSPAIGPDGTIYFSGTWNGLVHAVRPDCSLRWTYTAGAGILWSSPAISPNCNPSQIENCTLYIGDTKGRLHAINAATGVKRWNKPLKLQGLNRSSSPAIGADGTIYMGTTAGVSAVNPNGTLHWFSDTLGYVEATPAIGANGTIYVGTTTGRTFYAISATGTKLWTYKSIPADAFPTSPLIDGNDNIYVSVGKKVLSLTKNGVKRWEHATGNFINSSPAIGADGTLYIGSSDHKLYAFGD
jgi:outer membrane protein assembly factor BamB